MKTRHLTVMFTDIKGFTSRTSSSSREDLHKLLDLHDNLIGSLFEKYGGNIVKTIGDAFMVTFDSPTDALLCAMKIQKVLFEHNKVSEENDRMEVRIAINSGEVTVKGNDVYGEAVNIAARLEGIADAGEIYFTESVYLSMNKNEIPTAEVGYRHFKGVPDEVKVYKVIGDNKSKGFFSKKEKVIVRKIDENKNLKNTLKYVGIGILALFIFFILFNSIFNGNNSDQDVVDGEVFNREMDNRDDFNPDEYVQTEPRDEFFDPDMPQEDNFDNERVRGLEERFFELEGKTRMMIEEGQEMRARELLEEMIMINEQLGFRPEFEEIIRDLDMFIIERFE